MDLRPVLLTILIICAGCVTGSNTGPTISDKRRLTTSEQITRVAERQTTIGGQLSEASEQTSSTPSVSTPEPPSNPWEKKTVVVGIKRGPNVDNTDGIKSAVREAISYWENSSYGWYDVDYVLRPDSEDPDLQIWAVRRIRTCGNKTTNATYAYCSDVYERHERVGQVAELNLSTAFTPSTTVQAAKLAFGSLHGIRDGVNKTDLRPLELRYTDPWPFQDSVSVNLSIKSETESREWRDMVRTGIEYWQRNDERYGNYTKDLVFRPDSRTADITVQIVDNITHCGDESNTYIIGCADFYHRSTLAEDPTVVQIESGYTRETTIDIVKHEFGHVYGRPHNRPPMPTMNATDSDATLLPKPNVSSREWPWKNQTVRVYADYNSFDADREVVKTQVSRAVDYYDAGAEGYIPDSATIVLTQNRSKGDVVIRSGPLNRCTGSGDPGSCGLFYGKSTDSDSALEYYTEQDINITGIAPEKIGWHVGYWLGYSLANADSPDQLPPPFDEPQDDPRRSWWH
ncbi:MAG: hypothetical protein ABEI57_03585 [Halapricum sp.]